MHKVTFSVVTAIMLATASFAQADSHDRPCTAAPQGQRLSLEALQSKVETLGYKVEKAKLKRNCGELYAVDKTGARVELLVDPTNGEIVSRKLRYHHGDTE